MEVGRKEKRPQRGQAKGIKVKSKTRVEGSKLSAPMNFRKSPRIAPPQDESPFESSILLLCAASIRACSLLAATVSLRNSEGKVFHPPDGEALRNGDANFCSSWWRQLDPDQTGNRCFSFVSGIREWNSCLEFKLTFPHASPLLPHELLQSYAQLWKFFFYFLFVLSLVLK